MIIYLKWAVDQKPVFGAWHGVQAMAQTTSEVNANTVRRDSHSHIRRGFLKSNRRSAGPGFTIEVLELNLPFVVISRFGNV